jgi:hypothetical protein
MVSALWFKAGWDTRCRNECPARLISANLGDGRPGSFEVLDVGSGAFGIRLFLPERNVVGLDITVPAGRRGKWFVGGSVAALPFKSRSFPVVSCIDVLEHLPQAMRGQVIEECVRVARDAAVFAFPDGEAARQSDEAYGAACRRHGKPVPAWVQEHLEHEPPERGQVVRHIHAAAASNGATAAISRHACEPLAASNWVRGAAARSKVAYAAANLLCGATARIIRSHGAAQSYRTILVASLDRSSAHAARPSSAEPVEWLTRA